MTKTILITLGVIGGGYVLIKTKAITSIMDTLSQKTKSPATTNAPRTDQGNKANQPWYMGPVNSAMGTIQGAGTAALITASAGALAALSSTANDFFGSQPDSQGQAVSDQMPTQDQMGAASSDTNSNGDGYPVDQSTIDMGNTDSAA